MHDEATHRTRDSLQSSFLIHGRLFARCCFVFLFLASFTRVPESYAEPNPSDDVQLRAAASKIVTEAIDTFAPLIFGDRKTISVDFRRQQGFKYNLLGYVGLGGGFSNLMFGDAALHLTGPMLRASEVEKSDIIAMFSDHLPDSISSINIKHWIEFDHETTDQTTSLFGGSCYLLRLYIDGHIAKTIAIIDADKIGSWASDKRTPEQIITPAACFVAGIASHVGLNGVATLKPDQLIKNQAGRLAISKSINGAIYNLFGSGITAGMTQDAAKHKLVEYMLPREMKYLKLEYSKKN